MPFSPGNAAKVGALGGVVVKRIKAEGDFFEFSVSIGSGE